MTSQYHNPTQIIAGANALKEQGQLMVALGGHALVVTGAHSAVQSGAQGHLLTVLDSLKIGHTIFSGCVPNPTLDSVYAGVDLCRKSGADFIIAIGGGSPMDTAKAIAAVVENGTSRDDLFGGLQFDRALPLVCIPTTSGTGSEVTQYAVLTNDARQTKTSIGGTALFPRLAYLDGGYTATLPHMITVHTAIDALSHCIEGMLSNRAGPITDALAKDGIAHIMALVPHLMAHTLDDAMRERLMLASTLGGMVISATGTTAVHAMGYGLTYDRGTDHGRANGLLLPAFLQFCLARDEARILEILSTCGMTNVAAFETVMRQLLGAGEAISPLQAQAWAAKAITTGNIAKCRIPPTQSDIEAMYLSCIH